MDSRGVEVGCLFGWLEYEPPTRRCIAEHHLGGDLRLRCLTRFSHRTESGSTSYPAPRPRGASAASQLWDRPCRTRYEGQLMRGLEPASPEREPGMETARSCHRSNRRSGRQERRPCCSHVTGALAPRRRRAAERAVSEMSSMERSVKLDRRGGRPTTRLLLQYQ